MPPKRPASPTPASTSASKVFTSESIHDRKSVFVGYYSPDPSKKPKELQLRDDVRSASHRILGWRLPSNQQTLLPNAQPVFKTGHDDDGENWAGKKVEKVLEELNLQGTIMVARWYGGELLGPVRFKHIEDVAKGAVHAWRSENDGGSSKRARIDDAPSQISGKANELQTMTPEELAMRKKQAIETLQRRDESIAALRSLLEQKKASHATAASQSSQAPPSPARVPDYAAMPYNRLQGLENARDNTISFLLKSIDKAESEAAKRAEQAKKDAEDEKALKAAQEADELDDAWEEMAQAMEKTEKNTAAKGT